MILKAKNRGKAKERGHFTVKKEECEKRKDRAPTKQEWTLKSGINQYRVKLDERLLQPGEKGESKPKDLP